VEVGALRKWSVGQAIATAGFVLLVGWLAVVDSFYVVQPQQQAIVLRFGETERLVEPGLHFKIPVVEDVYFCDVTLVSMLEESDHEVMLSDSTPLSIDASITYRVTDCLRFFRTIRDRARLDPRMKSIFSTTLRETFGRRAAIDLAGKLDKIRRDVEARFQVVVPRFGVEVVDVKLAYASQ
jgi:membrane protease subunit HflC